MIRVVVVFVHAVLHAFDAAFDRIFCFFRCMIDRRARAFAWPARILIAVTRRHEQSHADETNHQRIAELMSQRVVIGLRNERIDHERSWSKLRSGPQRHDLPQIQANRALLKCAKWLRMDIFARDCSCLISPISDKVVR
jgi:hypothetical protein